MPKKKSRPPLRGQSSSSVDHSPFSEEQVQSNQEPQAPPSTPPSAPTVSVSPAATLAALPDSPQSPEPRALLKPPIPVARPRENSNETLKPAFSEEEEEERQADLVTYQDIDACESDDTLVDLLCDLDDSDEFCWLTGCGHSFGTLELCFLFDPRSIPAGDLAAVEDYFTTIQLNHAQHPYFKLFSQPNAILLNREIHRHFVDEGSFVMIPSAPDRRAILHALANANSEFRENIRYGNSSSQRQLDVSCGPFVSVGWEIVVLRPSLFPPGNRPLLVFDHGDAVNRDPDNLTFAAEPSLWNSSPDSHQLLMDASFPEPMPPFWRPTNRFQCNEPSTLMMCLAAHDKLQAYILSGSHGSSDLSLNFDPFQPSFTPTPGMVREGEISEIADEMKTIFCHIFDVDPPEDVVTVVDLLRHLKVIRKPGPQKARLGDRLSVPNQHPADIGSPSAIDREEPLNLSTEGGLRCDAPEDSHEEETASEPDHALNPASVSQNDSGETTFHYACVTAGVGASSRGSSSAAPSSAPPSTSSSTFLPEGSFGSLHPFQALRQDGTIDRQVYRFRTTGASNSEHYETFGVSSTSVPVPSPSEEQSDSESTFNAQGASDLHTAFDRYESAIDTVLLELHKLYDAFRDGWS